MSCCKNFKGPVIKKREEYRVYKAWNEQKNFKTKREVGVIVKLKLERR